MASLPFWLVETAVLAAAFLTALSVTPLVRRLAVRWKLGDKPNGRKINTRMIPHLGGIAIVLGTVVGVTNCRWIHPGVFADSGLLLRAAPALGLIVSLGLIDDMKNLRAIQKLAVQIVAALALSISGLTLVTGIGFIDATPMLVLVVSCLFFVGMSSATNLIDGHDGLAAGLSFLSAAAFAVVATIFGAPDVVIAALALGGACLGFLVFNLPPARIYMGDNGSMFLGTALAVVACMLSALRPDPVVVAGIALILGIPILDAMLAIARRVALRLPVFHADSLHVHHVLRQAGYTGRQTLILLFAAQASLCVLGVAAAAGHVVPVVLGVLLAFALFMSFIRMMVANRQTAGSVGSDIGTNTIPLKSPLQPTLGRRRRSVGR